MSGESADHFGSTHATINTFVTIVISVSFAFAMNGCSSPENKAEARYEEAHQAIQEERFDEAVVLFEQILKDYPNTPAAHRARQEIEVYRGLADADELYPFRVAQDAVIRVARALDRYRRRNGRYPDRLDRLVPKYLDKLPRDPWGRGLIYEAKSGKRKYVLACYGADGASGGGGMESDIVVENGKFIRGRPEGLP
jgi:hypothetical protein